MKCPAPSRTTLPPKSTTQDNAVEITEGPDGNAIEEEVMGNGRGSQLIVDIFMVIAIVALMI